MAKGYESSITLWENDGWFDNGTSGPLIPLIDSESLKRGLVTSERNTMARNTRAILEDSLVIEEDKPEGAITIIPRLTDIVPVLYSHFQMKESSFTGSSYLTDFVPSKHAPEFSDNGIYGNGTYGDPSGDAYSLDIWKKQADTQSGWRNTQQFKRGICNKLTFSQSAGDDFKIGADFKFKTYGSYRDTLNPTEPNAGSYSTGSITDWSHGTWSIASPSVSSAHFEGGLSEVSIECSNNLTEKKTLGAEQRQTFNFGDYTVKGQFTAEWLSDIYQEMVGYGYEFSIIGTIYHSDIEQMIIEIPNCRVKPHENPVAKPNEFIEVTVPFEAYESDGTAPIKVTTNVTNDVIDVEYDFWDAAFGARTLAEYDFADAGSTSRVLGDYDFADRDA